MRTRKVLPISDLHLEFYRDGGFEFINRLPEADVLIVAGDLSNANGLRSALKMLSQKYQDVIFVPGNHEYYGGTKLAVDIVRECVPDNVHWLDRNTVTLHGQRYVGCSLWFPDTPEARRNTHMLGDFYHIQGTDWIWEEFERCRTFLRDTVLESDVVITHHLPTQTSVSPRFVGDALNCYFVGDVSELVKSKWWIHGHTHDACDYMHGKTRVLCNPVGYPNERGAAHWKPLYLGGLPQ